MKTSLLFQLVDFSIWLPVVVGLLTLKSLQYYKVAYYFWFLSIVALIDFAYPYIFKDSDTTGLSTRVWYTILRPIEYAIYLRLFLSEVSSTPWQKYYKQVSLLVLIGLSLYTLLYNIDNRSAAAAIMILQRILLLFVLFVYFRQLLQNDAVLTLSETPLFWLSVGIFFYSAGNIIATGFYHRIYEISESVAKALYQINFILGILQYLLTTYCFYLFHKKRQSAAWKTY